MEFKDFRNESGLEFTDISSEQYRVYIYADGSQISVPNPIALNVSKSGGHRLFDAQGECHYIPKGWKKLSWTVKDGRPHFVR